MMPKILHFIWFGDNIPTYCSFAIRQYRNVNPDFEIKTYFKSISDIEHLYCKQNDLSNDDALLKKCIKAVLELNTDYTDQILISKNTFKMDFIQILADIFRLEVLNTYGGIYLDCDTYPLKPFTTLLDRKSFTVARHKNDNVVIPDCYFIGKQLDSQHLTTYLQLPQLVQTKKDWWKNIYYIKNRIKFFKCQLFDANNQFNSGFYIEHYNDNTWCRNFLGKNRTPKCKFDNYI